MAEDNAAGAPARASEEERPSGRQAANKTRRSPRKIEIDDDLKADWKWRYEQLGESVVSIAARSGLEETYVRRTAKQEGWVRGTKPLLGLSAAAKLAARAEGLASLSRRLKEARASGALALQGDGEGGAQTFDGDLQAATRELIAAIRAVIAEIEAMRAGLSTSGRRPTQASRAAHDLAMLSGALQRLQGLGKDAPIQGDDDDDIPEDIDAFRLDLARRISAFVASRTAGRDDAGDRPAAPVEEVL